MSFIRIKKIKGFRYAYRVENVWKKRKKSSRQRFKGYLGKAYRLEPVKEISFLEFAGAGSIEDYLGRNKEEIIFDLVKYELFRHGFEDAGKLVSNGKILVDLDNMEFLVDGAKANIVLEMNEGFMCKDTIDRLLKFKAFGEAEMELGAKLATAFLEAGLKVPEEVFVGFFSKLVK